MKISAYPSLSPRSFALRNSGGFASVLQLPLNCKKFVNARTGIYYALTLEGIGPGDEVLIPAYMCGSMHSPTRLVGADSGFFRINRDLSVDTDDLKSKITPSTRAILITHFFGFPQPGMDEIRDICSDRNITLIEDCAHALYGSFAGGHGSYVVVSLMKFLPVLDGGYLLSDKDLSSIQEKAVDLHYEAKKAINTLEYMFGLSNSAWLGRLTGLFARKKAPTAHKAVTQCKVNHGTDINAGMIERRMSWTSRCITRYIDHDHVALQRRSNYSALADACAELPGCEVLIRRLPDDVVPYVFPLLIENADEVYKLLRKNGVSVLRWEHAFHGNISGHCDISDYYSQHLVQFPCHQELGEPELTYMVDLLKKHMTKGAR